MNTLTILALGGAGCRIIKKAAEQPCPENVRFLAMDTDSRALEETGLPEDRRLLAGRLWRNGLGCGGDALAGQRAFSHERPTLAKMISGSDLLLITGGLGGGTASGGLSIILSEAVKQHIPTILLLTLPFAMEGYRRRKLADDTLTGDLLGIADMVLPLPNDLLFASLKPETPLQQAFAFADDEMARTLLGMTALLTAGNLLSADFSSLCAMLKRRKSVCGIGIGTVSAGEDGTPPSPEEAMEKLLQSPLLGGASRLQEADSALFIVLGGAELSLATAKAALELAERQTGRDCQLLLGAGNAPEWQGLLQLIAVAVKYDERAQEVFPESSPQQGSTAPRRQRGRNNAPAQGEQLSLPLADAVALGIMENTLPVLFDGENLDIPAYLRNNVVIEL